MISRQAARRPLEMGRLMELEILPLAITMMVGPQIMSAIIFVTTKRAVPTSLAFLAGVAIAATAGVAIALGIATLVGDATSLGEADDAGSTGNVVQYVLVGLLIARAIQSWVGRRTAEPPKWLGTLMEADWRRAFKTGLLLIFVMPSDVLIMLTVGVNLEQNDASLVAAIPFIALTVLIAALPLLAYLLFRRRAEDAMPKVRDWMTVNSWLVNIIVYCIFILLIT
jgi:Sap, sulfolipid-1-addressing protein